ncbi:hypothetical protein [Hydrogenibacillus sp. N12]|uniref:hypothetical protein n=1 Tax=Hydrogenibacillus sp. N12 TaxID=2866627 RepID=UPI001C7CC47A|nr:hypothetical protein [Hydrogenibacillus sp. N12]QZA33946.1 hypothetical protein K2M58_05435 [Hydrogenibacillus sp. N12]
MARTRVSGNAFLQEEPVLSAGPAGLVTARAGAAARPRATASPNPASSAVARTAAARKAGLEAGEKLLYFGYVLVLAVVYLAVLGRMAQAVVLNDRLVRTTAEIERLERENAALTLEVAELKRPERILAVARDMGLRPRPESVAVIAALPRAADAAGSSPLAPAPEAGSGNEAGSAEAKAAAGGGTSAGESGMP